MDSIEIKNLLTDFAKVSQKTAINATQPGHERDWSIIDFGCGTGRTTIELLNIPRSIVTGLEPSEKMLERAEERVTYDFFIGNSPVEEQLLNPNFFSSEWLKNAKLPTSKVKLLNFDPEEDILVKYNIDPVDSVVSTLVLEHVPMDRFFGTVKSLLLSHGSLLITNMHSDMGAVSQAGFIDPLTGKKIRPKSYIHKIEDVLAVAKTYGFKLVGDVLERKVTEEMVASLGPRARKWIGIKVWFAISFQLRREP